jgi:O-antigen ligase
VRAGFCDAGFRAEVLLGNGGVMRGLTNIWMGLLVLAAAVSFILYGLWLEKFWVATPVFILTYLALAGWVASGGWKVGPRTSRSEVLESPRGVKSESTSRLSHFTTHSIPPGGGMLLLFWLYSLVRIPFSDLPYEATLSTLGFGAYVSVYWAFANLADRFPVRKRVWTALLVLLILTALYSLVQHHVDPGRLFGIERYTRYWGAERLGGTYQCPNHIAHLYQLWLPFCLLFLFISQFGWFWRICFAYALPLFLVLIYQTQSRAGLLGAVASFGTVALLLVFRKSRRAFWIALLVIPLLCATVVGGLWAGSSMFRTRMHPVAEFIQQCRAGSFEFSDFRPQAWMDTVPMIADRPLFGFGPGSYGQIYEQYRRRVKSVRIEIVHAHSEYLELLAEYGAVGALLACATVGAVLLALIRGIRASAHSHHVLPAIALAAALAGTAVHGFFDFELRIFPNALMLAILAGCAVAPLRSSAEPSSSRVVSPCVRLFSGTVRVLFSLLVLGSALWSVAVFGSAWMRARGDTLLQSQQFRLAEKQFRRAVRLDPQNWLAHLGLGQVFYHDRYNELNPEVKQAWALQEQAAYAEAFRINPIKEEVVYGLGRSELFLGHRDRGLDLLRQAANYKRFNDFYWRKLGIELRKAGLYDEALNAFECAKKLDGSNPTVKRNIEWLRRVKGEK